MISYNLGYVDVRDGGDLGFEERLDIHNDEQNIEGGQPQKLLPTKCRQIWNSRLKQPMTTDLMFKICLDHLRTESKGLPCACEMGYTNSDRIATSVKLPLADVVPVVNPDIVRSCLQEKISNRNAPESKCVTDFELKNAPGPRFDANRGVRVEANIQGNITRDFAAYLTNTGVSAPLDKIRAAGSNSGGHTQMRFVTNFYTAQCMTEIIKCVRNEPGQVHMIIDQGAKFCKNARIFQRALADKNNWLYCPKRNDLWTYDASYHVQNIQTYQAMRNTDPRLQAVEKRFIDGAEGTPLRMPNFKYHVLTVDCLTYYVTPQLLMNHYRAIDPVFYVVGMNYLPFYGEYPYVAGNGLVNVSSRDGVAYIHVTTNGGGKYEHRISRFTERTRSVKTGFSTTFMFIGRRIWDHYSFVPLPQLSFNGKSLMVNVLQRAKVQTTTRLKAFTQEDLDQIFQEACYSEMKFSLLLSWLSLISRGHQYLEVELGSKNCCKRKMQLDRVRIVSRQKTSCLYRWFVKSCIHTCCCRFIPLYTTWDEIGVHQDVFFSRQSSYE